MGIIFTMELFLLLIRPETTREEAAFLRQLMGVGLFSLWIFMGGITFLGVLVKDVISKRMVVRGTTMLLQGSFQEVLLMMALRLVSFIVPAVVNLVLLAVIPPEFTLIMVFAWFVIIIIHAWYHYHVKNEMLIVPKIVRLSKRERNELSSQEKAWFVRTAEVGNTHACDHCGSRCSSRLSSDDCSCLIKKSHVEEIQKRGPRKASVRNVVTSVVHCNQCHETEMFMKEWLSWHHFFPLLTWSVTWTLIGIMGTITTFQNRVPLGAFVVVMMLMLVVIIIQQAREWRRMNHAPHVVALRKNVDSQERNNHALMMGLNVFFSLIPFMGPFWLLVTWSTFHLRIITRIPNALGTNEARCTFNVRDHCPRCGGPLVSPQFVLHPTPPRTRYQHHPRCRLNQSSSLTSSRRLSSQHLNQRLKEGHETTMMVRMMNHPPQWLRLLRSGVRIPSLVLITWLVLTVIETESGSRATTSATFTSQLRSHHYLFMNAALILLVIWFLQAFVKEFWIQETREEKHQILIELMVTAAFLIASSMLIFQLVTIVVTMDILAIVLLLLLLPLLFHRSPDKE